MPPRSKIPVGSFWSLAVFYFLASRIGESRGFKGGESPLFGVRHACTALVLYPSLLKNGHFGSEIFFSDSTCKSWTYLESRQDLQVELGEKRSSHSVYSSAIMGIDCF